METLFRRLDLKSPLGKLKIWVTDNAGEIATLQFALGKMTLGKYLTPFFRIIELRKIVYNKLLVFNMTLDTVDSFQKKKKIQIR